MSAKNNSNRFWARPDRKTFHGLGLPTIITICLGLPLLLIAAGMFEILADDLDAVVDIARHHHALAAIIAIVISIGLTAFKFLLQAAYGCVEFAFGLVVAISSLDHLDTTYVRGSVAIFISGCYFLVRATENISPGVPGEEEMQAGKIANVKLASSGLLAAASNSDIGERCSVRLRIVV